MTTEDRPPGLTDSEIKAPPDEPWEETVAAPAPVRAVAAAGGCVAAAGDRLYLLRPGSERLRPLSTPAGATIAALAVEPWSPYRVAVAWPHHVGIFSGHRPYEPLVEMEFPTPDMDATHLAWTRDANGIRVVARRHGGDIVRLDPKGATDVLNVRSASAVAGDDRGALAVIVDVETEDASVWIIRAADQPPEVRSMPAMAEADEADEEEERYELALHGPAVAFSWVVTMGETPKPPAQPAEPGDTMPETMVSWRPHDDEAQHFAMPPAALSGPLAFEDADVIYAAHHPAAGRVDVLRWARKGKVTRIARLGLDDEGRGTPATVTGLAWDASRRALWIASPERGLLRLHAPVTMGDTPKPPGATLPVATKPSAAKPAPARKVSLPTRTEDTWDGGFILDQAERVIDIRAGRGLVMAAGDSLFMLRPGAETWKARPPAEDLGAVLAIAAEPGPPYRYAVASEGGITVYGLPKDQILTLRAPSDELRVTHLAWGMLGSDRLLYMRWDDGTVGRLRMDLGNIEPLPLDPMDALAADADAVLALVNVLGDPADAHVLVTADGERFEERPALAAPEDLPDGTVHVAVAGTAVVYAVEGWGVYLSRGIDDDFVPCPGIPGGGPLAFQGTSPRAAFFGVGHERGTCVIHRVDPEGAVQRIVEIEGEGGEPPRFSAITWDESRRILWSASPQAGIMRSEEPRGKGGKKRSLS